MIGFERQTRFFVSYEKPWRQRDGIFESINVIEIEGFIDLYGRFAIPGVWANAGAQILPIK